MHLMVDTMTAVADLDTQVMGRLEDSRIAAIAIILLILIIS